MGKDFTKSWDPETGDPLDTSPESRPTAETLQKLKQLTIVGETRGNYRLAVQDISAYGCTAAAALAEVATFDEAGNSSSLRLLAVVTSGFLALLGARSRAT